MSLRVMIIDDDEDFRSLLAHHLETRWPTAIVREYDPLQAGELPEGFAGAGHDLVLLGDPAGDSHALSWLRRFMAVPGFPPVIFFGDGSERQIVQAIKAGAEDYLGKRSLNHGRLVTAIEHLLRSREPARHGVPGGPVPLPRGYEVLRHLAGGGLANVYLARQQGSGRELVLKVIAADPDAAAEAAFDRFLREYELIARVRHPNVVQIFDLGIADDHAYIAMEYCGGGSLKKRIAAGISQAGTLRLLREIAGALAALHRVGIWHRDLKPANVLFRADDSLALIDFGLARETGLSLEITGQGAIFGTPYYMSPEQGGGEPVDARGDIYSLGIIVHELLTGRKVYRGNTAMAVIVQHRQAPLPKLPAELAAWQPLLDRMLAKDPAARFQSVEELLAFPLPESITVNSSDNSRIVVPSRS